MAKRQADSCTFRYVAEHGVNIGRLVRQKNMVVMFGGVWKLMSSHKSETYQLIR